MDANQGVLAWLFDARIATAWLDLAEDVPPLLPQEVQLVASASPARQREFAGGRACARRAFEKLGIPKAAIGRGKEGEPIWPDGLTGSISHAGGQCVAAVARTADVLAVGVDIEIDGQEDPQLTARICSPNELSALRRCGSRPEDLARVVYSVKESLHKLQFPLTGEAIGLRRAEVILSADAFLATFGLDLPPPIRGLSLRGRWRRFAGLVWTAAWLPRI